MFNFKILPLLLVLFSASAFAQEPVAGRLSNVERRMTSGVNELAHNIDEFFSRDDFEVETKASRLRIGFATTFVEYEKPKYNFILGSKLVLPRTQEKLHLIFFSDEDDLYERKEGVVPTQDAKVEDSVQDQQFNLGLRSLLHKSRTSGVSFDAGIKIRDPIDPFVKLSARRSVFFSEYEFRAIERLYWFESEGWGSSVSLDLDRPITPAWLFRFSNNGVLDHETGLWEIDQFLALYQKYSDRTGLGYFVGVTSNDEPTLALQTYYISIQYRYTLIPDWLYLQITPKNEWPRDLGWHAQQSIQFKIESIFGG